MTPAISSELRSWVATVLADVTVSMDAPGARSGQPPGRGVSLYLVQLAAAAPPRERTVPPLQVWARYLVTTWAESVEERHALLETLLFAALEEAPGEVDLTPLPPELWLALGAPPQPSFVLCVLVKRARAQQAVPRVRQPLQVDTTLAVPLTGTVLGPEDVPLADALVEVPALQRQTRTDAAGRFVLPHVPGGAVPLRLRVRAKGSELEIAVPPDERAAPVIVRFATLA